MKTAAVFFALQTFAGALETAKPTSGTASPLADHQLPEVAVPSMTFDGCRVVFHQTRDVIVVRDTASPPVCMCSLSPSQDF